MTLLNELMQLVAGRGGGDAKDGGDKVNLIVTMHK
jgi:hypothetical protein